MSSKVFYTDGACKGNPGPGGFGVVSIEETQIRKRDNWGNWRADSTEQTLVYSYNESCNFTTNNREELKAILHVFQLAAADKDNKYIIYSDSAYAVNMINDWIKGWAKNNWFNSKKQKVENLDLVQEIYKYLTTDFFNCQVKKVAGHAGIVENELADALATEDMNKFNQIIQKNHILTNK